jgi:DNA-binding response OmpR family regulator
VARGLSLGADGYVTKPFKVSIMVNAVNTVLGLD